MFTMIATYLLIALISCVSLSPMFMAGIAYAQGATLWGLYPVLALFWFVMFTDWVSGVVNKGSPSEGDEDDEESD